MYIYTLTYLLGCTRVCLCTCIHNVHEGTCTETEQQTTYGRLFASFSPDGPCNFLGRPEPLPRDKPQTSSRRFSLSIKSVLALCIRRKFVYGRGKAVTACSLHATLLTRREAPSVSLSLFPLPFLSTRSRQRRSREELSLLRSPQTSLVGLAGHLRRIHRRTVHILP